MLLKLIILAMRNILLNRRRSLLTGGVMTFSVATIIFASALGEGFYYQMVDLGIRTTTGHILIYPKHWDFDFTNPRGGNVPHVPFPNKIEKIIKQVPYYFSHGKEIVYQMLLFDETDTYFIGTLFGVQPEKVDTTLSGLRLIEGESIKQGLIEGTLISPSARRFFKERSTLKLKMDSRLFLLTPGPYGMLEGIKTKFKGVAQTMPLFGSNTILTNLSAVQELLGWQENQFSMFKIILTDKDQAELVRSRLLQEFEKEKIDVNVDIWKENGGFYYYIALLGRLMSAAVLVVLAVITLITVSNTMLMSVKERTREIGTIMALGLRKNGIMTIFVVEASILACISSLLGLVIGVGISTYYANAGFLSGLTLLIEGTLFPRLAIIPVVSSLIGIIVFGIIGGTYPAMKASNLNPIEAIRNL